MQGRKNKATPKNISSLRGSRRKEQSFAYCSKIDYNLRKVLQDDGKGLLNTQGGNGRVGGKKERGKGSLEPPSSVRYVS